MDIFLYIVRQSFIAKAFRAFLCAFKNSKTYHFFNSPAVRGSYFLRFCISPYKILLFLSRLLFGRGFLHFVKFLFLK